MLQCCVSLSSVCTECTVAKRCVLEQKLLLTAYRKAYEKWIGTKMNEVVLRSCRPLPYIRRWISRKTLEIEAWFQWTTNRKWHMGIKITWPMTSRDPQRCCEAVRSAFLATARLVVLYWSELGFGICVACRWVKCVGNWLESETSDMTSGKLSNHGVRQVLLGSKLINHLCLLLIRWQRIVALLKRILLYAYLFIYLLYIC